MPIKKNIAIQYSEYSGIEELPLDLSILLNAAKGALIQSYSPYSQFKVASAVRLTNGSIVVGSNQENAAYTMCLCAERVALASVSSQFPNEKVTAIAILAVNKNGISQPVSPCGACRQTLKEISYRDKENIKIILGTLNSKVLVFDSIDDLLPMGFGESVL
jgi:cytidine deaminase